MIFCIFLVSIGSFVSLNNICSTCNIEDAEARDRADDIWPGNRDGDGDRNWDRDGDGDGVNDIAVPSLSCFRRASEAPGARALISLTVNSAIETTMMNDDLDGFGVNEYCYF